ncbi:2,4-dihydroxyhept-2-enedioate aldolase [Roseivivax lentus]|uniref:Hydroxypyruvate/pyruvate aldolase n=1 Tax=Roseivivax lentus TaxID=633194 RepID=A0A1N7MEK0_9RHOB|nr:HpcH/HpaI aldolase/citrate lyase family protein [Roseivivax lentus]SIS84468.1 2,4-dihydroxyhept-2-enedioate aldolase [Roseivivax lentus]
MAAPVNSFKPALRTGKRQIGLWMGLTDPYAAEIVATAGFDWVLIDGEHAPNDLQAIARQLQVIAPHTHPIVRLPMGEPWLIKQVLDTGAQTLLIPMVDSAEEARALVRAMRYPPEGIRGMGGMMGRATAFGRVADYPGTANDQMCLIVQIESGAALSALDEILAVDGVDAAFVGPADLSADLGYPGRADAPEMRKIIAETLGRIAASGKAAGIIDTGDAALEAHFAAGASFVAVGADVSFLSLGLQALARKWQVG